MGYVVAGILVFAASIGLIKILKPAKGVTVSKFRPLVEITVAIVLTVGLTLGALLVVYGLVPDGGSSSAISTPVKKQ